MGIHNNYSRADGIATLSYIAFLSNVLVLFLPYFVAFCVAIFARRDVGFTL